MCERMSTSEETGNLKNLEFLDKDWKLATVYTAFLSSKSQQDAIRLIYKKKYEEGDKKSGKKAPIVQPQNWIIATRKKLMNEGYLIRMDNELKNSVIKANIEPIVNSLIATHLHDSSDREIQNGLLLVLDSKWFRQLFSYGNLHSPFTYQNENETIYEPYQNLIKKNPSGDHLEIINLKNRLFQLLYEIGYYSHNIRYILQSLDLENEHTSYRKDPALKDLLAVQNFDKMLEKQHDNVPPRFIDTYKSCIKNIRMNHMDEQFPTGLINHLLDTHAGLFMPTQVSHFLSSCPCESSVRPGYVGYILKTFHYNWNKDK
jgi:hypothetical protein